jgi:hypothetical protein
MNDIGHLADFLNSTPEAQLSGLASVLRASLEVESQKNSSSTYYTTIKHLNNMSQQSNLASSKEQQDRIKSIVQEKKAMIAHNYPRAPSLNETLGLDSSLLLKDFT